MLKPLLLLIIVSIASPVFAQTFEGKIVYSNRYKSKMPGVTDAQFTAMMGDKQEYYIKGGDYKSVMNGTMVQWQLYINKDNKIYSMMTNSPALLYNEGETNPDQILKSEINRNVVKILGYDCDELILTCKSGIQRYYFNSKIGVDPEIFASHKFGNWSEYLRQARALPLKIVLESSAFTLEATATEVTATSLDDNLFVLPAGVKIEKSPF